MDKFLNIVTCFKVSNQDNVQGTSKRLSGGDFGTYFAREILNTFPEEFGTTAVYWTSSTAPMNGTTPQAYYRVMSTGIGDTGVSAFDGTRNHYMAVRCKRD